MGEIIKYGKIWGTDESTLSKTAAARPYGSSHILWPEGQHVIKVLYDNYKGDNEIPYENFTLDIIDTNTGEYPTWLIHYFQLTNIVTPLGSTLKSLYPDNTPPRYSINEWRFICGWNWLQDADTQSRSMEITFTESETGESVTHTLTQEGALAANKTPLNLGATRIERPLVTQSTGSVSCYFDKDDTFVGFGYPGDPILGYGSNPGKWYDNLKYSSFYYDGNRHDPEWEVVILDRDTGETADWITFTGTSGLKLNGTTRMSINFNLEFEANTTGLPRYFDLYITELNHNETLGLVETTTLGNLMFQPNR